jgi:hypothetical protein
VDIELVNSRKGTLCMVDTSLAILAVLPNQKRRSHKHQGVGVLDQAKERRI